MLCLFVFIIIWGFSILYMQNFEDRSSVICDKSLPLRVVLIVILLKHTIQYRSPFCTQCLEDKTSTGRLQLDNMTMSCYIKLQITSEF